MGRRTGAGKPLMHKSRDGFAIDSDLEHLERGCGTLSLLFESSEVQATQ